MYWMTLPLWAPLKLKSCHGVQWQVQWCMTFLLQVHMKLWLAFSTYFWCSLDKGSPKVLQRILKQSQRLSWGHTLVVLLPASLWWGNNPLPWDTGQGCHPHYQLPSPGPRSSMSLLGRMNSWLSYTLGSLDWDSSLCLWFRCSAC